MKLNKIMKTALVGAVALTMSLSAGLTASASDTGLTGGGTETAPAQGILTKVLEKALGVTTPGASFTFEFTAVSVDGAAATASPANMPAIGNAAIVFTSADNTDSDTATADVVEVSKNSADVLAGVTWPHAGEYVYNITETANTYTAGSGEAMTYSQEGYQMTVYVANGSPDGKLYVSAVGFKKITDATGTTIGSPVKADPVFTNIYEKTAQLTISKNVAGTYADQTKLFEYGLTLTKSPTDKSAGERTYNYKIYNPGGGTPASTGTVTTGTPVSISLKHGQYVEVEDLNTGVTYVLNEVGTTDYAPEVNVTINGGTAINQKSTTPGDSMVVGSAGASAADLQSPINIGEGTNTAAWINTYKTVTPTGILLNNLPFIIMIVLAVGGFSLYIVSKRRKAVR